MAKVIRNIEFKILANTWPSSNVPSRIKGLSGLRQVDLCDLTTMIALYTAPPSGYGFELSYRWASLRYLPAFQDTALIKLRPEWNDIDAHQKTILSDDFGFAFGAYIAEQCLGPGLLMNAAYFLELARRYKLGDFTHVKRSKRGPSKTPDFIHVRTTAPVVDIIECKGSQTPDYVENAVKMGVDQKKNIGLASRSPGGLGIGERLVVGVYLANHSSNQSYCLVRDPPEIQWQIPDLSFEECLALAARYDFARAAALMGLPDVSALFWWGEEAAAAAAREVQERRPSLRRRASSRGDLDGTSFIFDFPRELPAFMEKGAAPEAVVSTAAQVEMPSAVLEAVSQQVPLRRIIERAVADVRRDVDPSRPRTEPESVVQTPFDTTVSVQALSRDQRAARIDRRTPIG